MVWGSQLDILGADYSSSFSLFCDVAQPVSMALHGIAFLLRYRQYCHNSCMQMAAICCLEDPKVAVKSGRRGEEHCIYTMPLGYPGFCVHRRCTHLFCQPLVVRFRPFTPPVACLTSVAWTNQSASTHPRPPPSCLAQSCHDQVFVGRLVL